MKQAVMTAPGRIELRDVPAPEVAPEQVLVRMKRIGVCGSDIHVFHGKHPLTPYPVVQGHEVSGVVERTGSAVRGLSPGDPVTLQPQVTCGVCYPCRHGAYHICDKLKVMGFQTTGAASELFAVDSSKVLRLPKSMSLEQGAMVEPLAVSVHAIERVGGAAGKKVVVLGVFGDKPVVDMGTVQDRELRLVGTLMYQQPDWVKAISLIDQGKVDLAPLVTDRFAFADYQKAYEYIDANRERAMKVMIVVDA